MYTAIKITELAKITEMTILIALIIEAVHDIDISVFMFVIFILILKKIIKKYGN